MNKVVTSKEALIETGKKIIVEKGFDAFSMRVMAEASGVAVGSIYNYFPSKGMLMSAIISEIWEEIFAPLKTLDNCAGFGEAVTCLLAALKEGEEKYPGFFLMHSMQFASGDKEQGKETMFKYFGYLIKHLASILERDEKVRPGVFSDGLTPTLFAKDILTLAIVHQVRGEGNNGLCELVENAIY